MAVPFPIKAIAKCPKKFRVSVAVVGKIWVQTLWPIRPMLIVWFYSIACVCMYKMYT